MTTHTHKRGPKPAPAGSCQCGAPCVDYEPMWGLRRGAAERIAERGDVVPSDYDGTESWKPVCYPVTPSRFTSRPYIEHVIRIGEAEGEAATVALIRKKYAAILGDTP